MGYLYRGTEPFTGIRSASFPLALNKLPIYGASREWNASSLDVAIGTPVTSWVDVASNTALTAVTGSPTLEMVDGVQAVRFTNDIMQQTYSLAQPHTVALSFKHVTLNTVGTATIFGAQVVIGSDGGVLQTNTLGDMYLNAGAGAKVGSASGTTGWHRVVAVFDGTSSTIVLDGVEYVVNAGTLPRAAFSLGGQRNGQFTDIAVTHASIFPRAIDATERADLDSWLAGQEVI